MTYATRDTYRASDSTATSTAEPFNLRLTRRPMRCVTGLTIPPGLVGFCWETPLSLEVLDQQAPELARIVRGWTQSLQPAPEEERSRDRPHLLSDVVESSESAKGEASRVEGS